MKYNKYFITFYRANMSQDYFTNRQDRYIVIRDCPALADFFSKLVDVVSQFSYQMDESNTAQLNEACQGSPGKQDAH